MPEREKRVLKRWSKAWQEASRVMNDEKKARISAPGYYKENLKALDEMLQYANTRCRTRLTSGLVEMQRIFSQLKP